MSIGLKAASVGLVLIGSLLSACGGSGGIDSSTNLLGGGLQTGEVLPLNFDANGQATLTFGDLSGGEEFALLFFAANAKPGTFDIELKSATFDSNQESLRLLQAPNSFLPPSETDGSDVNSLFHNFLREEESLIGKVVQDFGSEKLLATEGASEISCSDNRGILFKILNSMSNTDTYDTVCGRHYRTTDNVIFYVDESIWGQIPDQALDEVVNDFEAKIPRQRNLLGNESDVNEDGRIAVCFCPGVNRLGASIGGYVTGYFYGGDLFPQTNLSASNEKEVLFISVPDPNGQWGVPVPLDFWLSNIAPTVLTHEYQHMINYHYKVMLAEIGAEESWANEGISHLMEDLSAHSQDPLSETSMENPSRVGLYLQDPQGSAFTQGTSLAQRGGAYLFFRYLYEQANLGRYPNVADGREFLTELVQSPAKGLTNIEETLGWPLRNLLLDFYATLELSDTGLSDNPRYNFHGISLIGDQDDNRGTILSGVQNQFLSTLSLKGAVNAPGGIFYQVTGDTLNSSGKSIDFVASPGMIPGGAVVRLK